jgi:pyruvate formate lyase activating enzyme
MNASNLKKIALNLPTSSEECKRPAAREPQKLPRPVYAVTPFTMLDFPNKTACIIWFAGCNMRCPYCHNPQIIKSKGRGTVDDIWRFLNKRQGLLDGVVLSGGEATSYPDIISFAQKLRELGYSIKLDTNGTRPTVVKEMLDKHLVDYIALDYKSPPEKFLKVAGIKNFETFNQTLETLCLQSNIPFEIRTTVHTDLLDEDDINKIINTLEEKNYQGTYYIQNYIDDNDRPTLGNLRSQSRLLDKSRLLTPTKFNIEFRNFPQ